jgi:hypothetical protein
MPADIAPSLTSSSAAGGKRGFIKKRKTLPLEDFKSLCEGRKREFHIDFGKILRREGVSMSHHARGNK